MADKYLYGASVQGIQNFIFQTNKLKEIVGASELVEEICTKLFQKTLSQITKSNIDLDTDKNCILHAAGNIKYVFNDVKPCEDLVKVFPKLVQEFAPGITVSQSVVVLDNDNNYSKAVLELEKKLRIQRNLPMRSSSLGLMGIKRSSTTGLPAVDNTDGLIDASTKAKLARNNIKSLFAKSLGKKVEDIKIKKIALDTKNLCQNNDWIAIIHADGNGLGQIVQKIKDKDDNKEFSSKLDKSTVDAAVEAYKALGVDEDGIIPLRPIVLGGDDLTVICRAELAIDYVKNFIEAFERNTRENLNGLLKKYNVFEEGEIRDGLTACAGIAFIKSSFPFYYGYRLAEELCSAAKKDAKDKTSIKNGKELPASCLMFHKVQDSFTENYETIEKRELTPNKNTSFKFGPYYISEKACMTDHEGKWSVDKLLQTVRRLHNDKDGNALKSSVRNWMSTLATNPAMAEQVLNRMRMIVKSTLRKDLKLLTEGYSETGSTQRIPAYDVLSLNTIYTPKTEKGDKNERH